MRGEERRITARDVLSRAAAAMGGGAKTRPSLRAAAGHIEVLGGLAGAYRSWAMPPGSRRVEWTVPGLSYAAGCDGVEAWERVAGVRELAGEELRRARRQSELDPVGHALEAGLPATLGQVAAAGGPAYAVRIELGDGGVEWLQFDAASFCLLAWTRRESHEEGAADVSVRYSDYRRVGALLLPHRIDSEAVDLPHTVWIDEVQQRHPSAEEAAALFRSPSAARGPRLLALDLAVHPGRVFKEGAGSLPGAWVRTWGIPNAPAERWTFNVLVRERLGRPVEPLRATAQLWSAGDLVKTEEYGAAALGARRRRPAARFFPPEELFHLRHQFAEPSAPAIDRVVYTLTARAAAGPDLDATLAVPIVTYEPKTRLRFPLRGLFYIAVGHDPDEISHCYERSQQFAYDIVPLASAADPPPLWGTGVEREVIAPAAGVVVRARDDVPDEMPPHVYLRLPDPLWAVGGNGVLIDHENGEWSALFHLRHGSVRVGVGDRVQQGAALGLVGSSGSPGYFHLHYHLQHGPELFAADGLPSRFANVELATDRLAPLRRGTPIAVPVRGLELRAR